MEEGGNWHTNQALPDGLENVIWTSDLCFTGRNIHRWRALGEGRQAAAGARQEHSHHWAKRDDHSAPPEEANGRAGEER